ncbi:MAG: NAD(P)-dependent oxidoreductase [Beijerinckiaceae bacterium]|jgi:3-hydroxyisobutyrate dehydrogenase|nr:NAD(P)-dependent oxidoreductase [Beijerinckiaceae bacterium]
MPETGTAKPRLGYVGIGLMGLPMVRHLLPKGYAITAFDIAPARCEAAREAGARIAATPAGVVDGADLVILNLPTLDAVEQVMFGSGGVAAAMQPGQILVDFSTIPVDACRRLGARLLAERGCGWVDTPVSGGPPASGTGTLTVMAGGREADLARIAPLMADVAGRYTIMGGPGAGMVAKMINQMIVGCTHAVLAEALMVAEAAGIDAKRIPECLAGGHADSNLLQRNYPRMANREFAPQGYARQMLKDLEMVNVFTAGLKTATPMTADALNLYRMAVHFGHAELDTTALVKVYDREG